ncbi:MAG: chemotaxis-specific protein-glutamate methyltransferase CheB [Planctomycetota bacterium]|jgi:two-component system chemotaxis response regulator CheB
MAKVRILVVDDSVVVRRLVARVLEEDPALEVVGTAPNGRIALAKLEQLAPDLVTLDIEMPEMDGLTALARMRKEHPDVKVIMFSVLTERGALHTLDALSLGAVDYVTKPARKTGPEEALRSIREKLVPRIHAICCPKEMGSASAAADQRRGVAPEAPAVIAVAASTGGPDAVPRLLQALPRDFSLPILVVQHMPALFTRLFARRLDAQVPLPVAEAADGTSLDRGGVWIAPGGMHLVVERKRGGLCLGTQQGPAELSCRPSANVLFRSVARHYGPGALAMVLTGMGRDGLEGCREIRRAGGRVLAQDKASSVVWGMPGFVVEAGLTDSALKPEDLAREITHLACGVGQR